MYSSDFFSASPARRTRAEPWVRRMPTELSFVSEKSWSGGGAITSVLVPMSPVLGWGRTPRSPPADPREPRRP